MFIKTYHVHYHTECINKSVRFYTHKYDNHNEAKKAYERALRRTSTRFARLLERTKNQENNKATITWEILEERIGKNKPF